MVRRKQGLSSGRLHLDYSYLGEEGRLAMAVRGSVYVCGFGFALLLFSLNVNSNC